MNEYMIGDNQHRIAASSPLQPNSSTKLKLFLLIEVIIITALLVLVSFAWKKVLIEPNQNVASVGIDKFVRDLVNIPPNEVVLTNQYDIYSAKPKTNEVIVYKDFDKMRPIYGLRWLVDNKL